MNEATVKRIQEARVLGATVHFTDAPASYDYTGITVDLGPVGYVMARGMNRGEPIRAIATALSADDFMRRQGDRYRSGMYLVWVGGRDGDPFAPLWEDVDLLAEPETARAAGD